MQSLPSSVQALGNAATFRATFINFCGEMAHFWQGTFWSTFRTGDWLTAARARGYILLGVYTLAFAGWIAVSDGTIDRNGKPLGTDFSNVYAAGLLTWQGRAAEAYRTAAWLVASFDAYLAMLRAILPRGETLLIAAAFPAVFIKISHGHNV